jgi:hypothetical protein
MTEPVPPLRSVLQIDVPDDVDSAYGDFTSVWHTADVFVLDFIALKGPPHPIEGPDGAPVLAVPGRVTQRIRIPPAQVFELMKALETHLSQWEAETGAPGSGG